MSGEESSTNAGKLQFPVPATVPDNPSAVAPPEAQHYPYVPGRTFPYPPAAGMYRPPNPSTIEYPFYPPPQAMDYRFPAYETPYYRHPQPPPPTSSFYGHYVPPPRPDYYYEPPQENSGGTSSNLDDIFQIHDEEGTVSNLVFISNLPADITNDQLQEEFSKAGRIKKLPEKSDRHKVWIYKDRAKQKGFAEATVWFEDNKSASEAISMFDQKELFGTKVSVQLCPKRELNNQMRTRLEIAIARGKAVLPSGEPYHHQQQQQSSQQQHDSSPAYYYPPPAPLGPYRRPFNVHGGGAGETRFRGRFWGGAAPQNRQEWPRRGGRGHAGWYAPY